MISSVIRRLRQQSAVRVGMSAGVYTFGALLPQAVNIALLPALTRHLDPAEIGLLSYTYAVCTLLTVVGSLTLHTYILRHYYRCDTDAARRSLFSTVFIFLLGYNTVLLCFQLAFLPKLFAVLNVSVPFSPYFDLALIATAIETTAIVPLTLFRVKEQPWRFVSLAAAATLLGIGCSLLAVVGFGWGAVGRLSGQLVADVIMFAVYVTLMWRLCGWGFNRGHILSALAFCLPLVPAQLLASFDVISDRVVLERFVSMDRLGIYAVAVSIGAGLHLLASGMFRALEPPMFRLATEHRLDLFADRIRAHVMLAITSGAALVVLFSREIVSTLASPAYVESAGVLVLIAISVVLRTTGNYYSTFLLAHGVPRYEAVVRLAGTATSVAVALALVPRFGIYGAAIASIASASVVVVVFRIVVGAMFDVRWRLVRDLVGVFAILGVCAALSFWSAPSLWVSVGAKAVPVIVGAILVARALARGAIQPAVDGAKV